MKIEEIDYDKLIDELKIYVDAYYNKSTPLISDKQYDELYDKVLKYEAKYPLKIRKDSPTQNVELSLKQDKIESNFKKQAHISAMWSLEKVVDDALLKAWLKKLKNSIMALNKQKQEGETPFSLVNKFIISPKFDGASLNLYYENGELIFAATRGDGKIGESVTKNALMIKGVKKNINLKGSIEIRGEVVMSNKSFNSLNDRLLQNNDKLFANPRNAASGSLRQLDSNITKQRNLEFLIWGVGEIKDNALKDLDSNYLILQELLKLGFSTKEIILSTQEEITLNYEKILRQRDDYDMQLDGVVCVLDKRALNNALGFTQKAPKYAFAYKFKAQEKEVFIKEVINQVGRTGIITPVAIFEPVNLEGANITKATLHNYEEIKRKDIRLFDTCLLVRSGDVIPKITKVLLDKRKGIEQEIKKPELCPSCSSLLMHEDVYIYCNNLSCRAIIKSRLNHFVSKRAMNIEGLAQQVINLLFDLGKIDSLSSIYSLKLEDLLELEGFKQKRSKNIIDSIKNSINKRELWRLIHSLGILHIGEVASKKLEESFGLSCFSKDLEELQGIEGFGVNMAQSFKEFCNINMDLIKELLDITKPVIKKKDISKNNLLANKTCVITGSFEKKRDELKEILERNGIKVTSSVTKKTDFLLLGSSLEDKSSTKFQKAKEFGIQIITELEINDIIKRF